MKKKIDTDEPALPSAQRGRSTQQKGADAIRDLSPTRNDGKYRPYRKATQHIGDPGLRAGTVEVARLLARDERARKAAKRGRSHT